MTFGGQVRWAISRGLLAGTMGVALAFVAVIFEAYGPAFWHHLTGNIAVALIFGGAGLVFAGGVLRPLHRWLHLRRRAGPTGRAIRLWLHLDASGCARND